MSASGLDFGNFYLGSLALRKLMTRMPSGVSVKHKHHAQPTVQIAQRDITRFATSCRVSVWTSAFSNQALRARRIEWQIPLANVALYFWRDQSDAHNYIICTIGFKSNQAC